MKQTIIIFSGILLVIMLAGTALAIDINTLDKVSVHMPQSQVRSLLGSPDEVIELGSGLTADIYKVSNAEPMIGAGCIYQDNRHLVGQAFIFQGIVNKAASERLVKHGFSVTEETEEVFRLVGKDDDTGQPLVAQISLNNGMTVIMTFEKVFHESWGK
ncbi:MAG: hypothetical protein PHD01_18865 [Geobacteraceae bacterium]|nr:hypothetical protein [Geobacteraceae bacterium]